MSLLHNTYEFAIEVESASAVFNYSSQALFSKVCVLVENSDLLLCKHSVSSEFFLYISCKACLELNKIECIADLHEAVILFLRHDLTVFSGSVCDICKILAPWELNCLEFFVVHIADISLIRCISYCIPEASDVLRKLLEILPVRVDYSLSYLSSSVMDNHVRCVCECVARAS